MARPDVPEDLICWPPLGSPLADALQAVTDLDGQACSTPSSAGSKLCKRVCAKCARSDSERVSASWVSCAAVADMKIIAFGVQLVKNAEGAESPNDPGSASQRTGCVNCNRERRVHCSAGQAGASWPLSSSEENALIVT